VGMVGVLKLVEGCGREVMGEGEGCLCMRHANDADGGVSV